MPTQSPATVTINGLAWALARIAGQGLAASHIAIGTGSTAPEPTDTALVTEVARIALSNPAGTIVGDQILFEAEFPPGTYIGTVHEIGLYNEVVGGTLIARSLKGPYTMDDSASLVVTMSLQLQLVAA
ncbi:hypothetical protein SIID45300_02379 [Candidatus Magnetaquicoccaceae bacterium FCR-1]|uniref:Uncharacterized protein n=1 Tax=Candidatus Magnetaquiglobus chichijimensis TaxID=3141448 RepID=A0ABQ0CAX7_9PROT